MEARRELKFDGLDAVMPEVGRLLDGHETAGRWSLAQILYHIGTAIRISSREASTGATTRAPSPRWEERRRRFFNSGRFPEGVENPLPILEPPPGLDERAEAESLGDAIEEFGRSNGPFPLHPRLGPLSKPEWATFHAMHCAHHLAFALPIQVAVTKGGGSP